MALVPEAVRVRTWQSLTGKPVVAVSVSCTDSIVGVSRIEEAEEMKKGLEMLTVRGLDTW